MTRRRWIADTWTPTTATLTGDQAIHLARVLRAEPGQIFDIVANGFLHRADISTANYAANTPRRTDIPEIADPTQLKPALEQEKTPTRILLSETEQTTTLTAALENLSTKENSNLSTKDRVPHPSRFCDGWDVNSS